MARTGLLRRLAFGLLGGLSALAAHAASPVWAVRGPHATVYLAGSVHLLPADDAGLPAAFDRAYRDSARLVMELDLAHVDSAEVSAWLLSHGALPPGTTLKSVLGAERYAQLAAAAAGVGLPVRLLDGQAPWVVALELADLDYVRLGLDPAQGVEEQLVRRAQDDGRPTAGLETLDEELGSLQGLSRADQLRLIDQTLDDLKEAPDEMHDVLSAWRAGDAQRLADLLSREYQSFPALYAPLVTARNAHWIGEIEQLLAGRENVLVVVGALHLVGEGGLLERLRRDGYAPAQLE